MVVIGVNCGVCGNGWGGVVLVVNCIWEMFVFYLLVLY